MESLLFTREDLKKLIVPLIIEQALALSIGLFDTLMVSSCGEAAVSGVSLVDSISVLLIQILSALATGGAVVCSQYIGKKMPERAKLSAGQLMFIMLVSAGTVMVVILLSYRFLLRAIFGQIDADVMQNAEIYFIISAISYPFLGVYNAGAALFRAIGNSKVSMYTSLVMNVINIGGNAVLIFGFGLGVMGAALATLTARIVSALVMVVLLSRKDNPLCIATPGCMKPQRDVIGKILKIGIPSGLENGMFQIGKLLVSSLTANSGNCGECGGEQCGGICQYSGYCDRTCDRDGHWQMHRSRGKRTGEILQQASAWSGLCGNGAGGSGTVCTCKTNHCLLRAIGGSGTDCHTASGKFRNLRGADLAAQLYPSECAARRRGCKVHDGGQRFFHVGIPCGKQLLFCGNDGTWRARCLDRHVCGLGVPHAAFCDPLPAWEVAGKARGMMPQGNGFLIFSYFLIIEFHFCGKYGRISEKYVQMMRILKKCTRIWEK